MARSSVNPLNDQLKILLTHEEKEGFMQACEKNETTISIQLRKFIKQYIEANKE